MATASRPPAHARVPRAPRAFARALSRVRVARLAGLGCALALLAMTAARAAAVGPEAGPSSRPAVVPPAPVVRVDAVYPPQQLAAGRSAEVVLAVTIDAAGAVTGVEVLLSAGADFDEAARTAARAWRFRPALRAGAPVASRIRLPFRFAAPFELAPPPAAPSAPQPRRPPRAEPQVLEVTVLGRPSRPSRGASDFQLEVGELARVPRRNATELLQLAPGMLLTNEGGEGHAEQIFLRGFDAREGQDLELSVGGVPVNQAGNLHGNGHADLHFVIPELIHGLRVLEGPFDPRQGNFAVAGSAEYELGLARRGLTAKYGYGSFATQRLLALWGPPGSGPGTFGGAELLRSAGFGANRDSTRATAMGQLEGRVGARGHWRLAGTAYATRYHSAGVLRADDVARRRVGFFDTYDRRQGGDVTRFSLAAELEWSGEQLTHGHQFFALRNSMRLLENFTGFLLDSQQPQQNLHRQRGDLIDLNNVGLTVGARGFGRWRGRLLGQRQELELGYAVRGDFVEATQYRNETATSVPYRLETAIDAELSDLGLYADANLRATHWLSLRGGLRAEAFTFNALDRCAVDSVAHPSRSNPPGDRSCLDSQDYGRYREPVARAATAATVFLPRVTLVVGPLFHLTASASAGRGIRSIDPIYLTQDVATPFASITAYEGGLAYARRLGWLELAGRGVLFGTQVDRDLIFSETAGRNTLAQGTTRRGWLAALRARATILDLSGSLTQVHSTFDDTGLLVPYVPELVLRGDGTVHGALPRLRLRGQPLQGHAALGLTWVGRRPLPYGQRSDVLAVVDGALGVAWRELELVLTLQNVLDRRYRLGEYNYASNFDAQGPPALVPARHFTAGAPRTLLLTLGITLGGQA